MKAVHFDMVGGASGDMILAALVDLGAPVEDLIKSLATLNIGPFDIRAEQCVQGGMRGMRVTVIDGAEPAGHARRGGHAHSHEEHAHAGNAGGGGKPHPHRGLADIRKAILGAALHDTVRGSAIRVFERLAAAEAAVHGTTPDEIHFHEVGAVDSIVDIVGACAAMHMLGIEAVAIGPFPIGYGTVVCAHGTIPLPAPATAEMIRGFPAVTTGETAELVTPTGAALLTTWKSIERMPAGRLLKTGCAFGRHSLKDRPNLLRALLFETGVDAGADECRVLECNIDDTTPELLGNMLSRLGAAGALDAFLTPVQMKKQRPGSMLTVLCKPRDQAALEDLVFRECTTFGIRSYAAGRTVLARRFETVRTAFGEVRVKVGQWKGEDITRSPEYEDCVRLADRAGVPVRAVYEQALRSALR